MKSAIVGCGSIATVHGTVLTQHIATTLTGAADINFPKAQKYAETYAATPYASLTEMLDAEKPDVLHICTPHYLHVPMAIEALQRGIHVFMEKPPVMTYAQLEELKIAAAKSDHLLGFCYQNRYNPCIQAAKKLIVSGETGKILGARAFVTWCRGEKYYTESGWRGKLATEGGGVLINQSIHTMDLLSYLLGKPNHIEASMSNHHLKEVIEVEDTLEAYLTFGDLHATFFATTSYCADIPPLIEIVCEHMTLRIEDPDLTILRPDAPPEKPHLDALLPIGKSYWGSGHLACISDFYHSIETGEPFALDLPRMEPSIRMMLGAYESAREHHPVDLKG